MMTTVGNEPFLSLESRAGDLMTVEEERDHYRQRFQSMKLVLKELQQQLTTYKTRCSGVNTVAAMLKESKQEVAKLTKQRKALETAIANLQNRLSTNGLSDSVNIEETELFVPGASKQTLDNLAKENARLRTLLKSQEGQSGKKPSEDVQNLTMLVEKLEMENNKLQAQLLESENLKIVLASEYEKAIEKIKDDHQTEKLLLRQELNGTMKNSKQAGSVKNIEKVSQASQTFDVEPSKVSEVRQALRILSDHCLALDESLKNVPVMARSEKEEKIINADTKNMVSQETYMEAQQKLNQVIQMNQRWQAYNENQEQQIHGFLAKIGELEQLNKEVDGLRSIINTKEMENKNLKRDISILTQEVTKLRSQPQIDTSLVEILKQQIQVCTEDFNTERKDREHAVGRAKQLQEEVNRLKNENEVLRRDIENLRKAKSVLEAEKRDSQVKMTPLYSPRNRPMLPQKLPFSSTASSGSTPSGPSLSPVPSPVPMSYSSTSSSADRLYLYPQGSPESGYDFQSTSHGGFRQHSYNSNQSSLPQARGPREASPTMTGLPQKHAATNVSMPNLSSNTEGFTSNRKPDLTCPKCGKEFTETQQSDLINHINSCSD